MAFVFWTCLALVGYSYALYPALLLFIHGRLKPVEGHAQPEGAVWPSVAIIVAAHNEERHIGARIHNLLALDYPEDLYTIHVGSDGSTDRTVQIATELRSDRVRLAAYSQRRGKASVLNDQVAVVDTEILVFTDANTVFDASALKCLVAPFRDPTIGVVCGELRLRAAQGGDNQDDRYWTVESAMKRAESAIGGLLGANGGIYAMRRALYRPIPPDTIVDDFVIAMSASTSGGRAIFEPRAIAHEDTPPDIADEYRRRVRIGQGNYQAFFRHPEYLFRGAAVRRFTYLSHKVLRWFAPHLMILVLLASGALAFSEPPYGSAFALQLACYGLLAFLYAVRARIILPSVLRIPVFLFALNAAFLVGFWRYLSGPAGGQWQRTQRT